MGTSETTMLAWSVSPVNIHIWDERTNSLRLWAKPSVSHLLLESCLGWNFIRHEFRCNVIASLTTPSQCYLQFCCFPPNGIYETSSRRTQVIFLSHIFYKRAIFHFITIFWGDYANYMFSLQYQCILFMALELGRYFCHPSEPKHYLQP